jgi:DNA repair exonuclease SbcCD ATPase subunit
MEGTMGRKSRAKRLSEVISDIRSELEKVREIQEDKKKSDEQKLKEINEILTCIDASEIESLKDEISEWKSNIEEKFSATQKYADLEDCESTLEEGYSEIEQYLQEVDSLDMVEDTIASIESGLDTCEGASFPGMFG